eukprot:Rmarinus@m.3109
MHPPIDVTCAVINSLVVRLTSDTSISWERLHLYGLETDPYEKSFTQWLLALKSVTGERELILAAALLCRALEVSWETSITTPVRDLSLYNRHRSFFVALILVDKFYTDDPYKLSSWASRFRYWDAHSLMQMELMFLKRLKWQVDISPAEFNRFLYFLHAPEPLLSRQLVYMVDDARDSFVAAPVATSVPSPASSNARCSAADHNAALTSGTERDSCLGESCALVSLPGSVSASPTISTELPASDSTPEAPSSSF